MLDSAGAHPLEPCAGLAPSAQAAAGLAMPPETPAVPPLASRTEAAATALAHAQQAAAATASKDDASVEEVSLELALSACLAQSRSPSQGYLLGGGCDAASIRITMYWLLSFSRLQTDRQVQIVQKYTH